MPGFISALIKQRKDAKEAKPDTNGRLKEIISIIRNYDYSNGITPEIVANILQDLGPTFVKIGQIASQQAEYIPDDYCAALSKLRSRVKPMTIDEVHAQLEKHLGKPADQLFKSFDDKPLGSASIAQVHKATLHDGTVVAVKVRRPGVVDTVARDFALIEKVLKLFVKGDIGGIDVKGLVLELERVSKQELDFTNEANNIERFWENNHERENIISPKCYRDLTCEAVLTEDFVMGKEVSDTENLDKLSSEERERLAGIVADNFATQILTDGFYHADPHSGNVFINDGGIEWIDFGMMGTLSSKQRQSLIDIVTNVVMQDAYGLKRTLMQVAKPKGEINHGKTLEMCEDMCSQYNGTDFGDFKLGNLLSTILNNLQDANFAIEPFLTNLARGIVAAEGTIKTLSPKVNILNFFTDKVDTGLDLNIDTENLKELNPEIAKKLLQLAKGIINSSTKTAEALDMLEKGQIKVRTDFSIEEKTLKAVNKMAGCLIRAFIISALFIGSSLLCLASGVTESSNGPLAIVFRGIGFFGFALSAFCAFMLYRYMKKSA